MDQWKHRHENLAMWQNRDDKQVIGLCRFRQGLDLRERSGPGFLDIAIAMLSTRMKQHLIRLATRSSYYMFYMVSRGFTPSWPWIWQSSPAIPLTSS
jgi:hypothetical protein